MMSNSPESVSRQIPAERQHLLEGKPGDDAYSFAQETATPEGFVGPITVSRNLENDQARGGIL